jgi:hypothetical protein
MLSRVLRGMSFDVDRTRRRTQKRGRKFVQRVSKCFSMLIVIFCDDDLCSREINWLGDLGKNELVVEKLYSHMKLEREIDLKKV